MILGVNLDAWPDVSASVAGLTGVRAYHQPADGVPAEWRGDLPARAVPVVSLRPNPYDLLAGEYDADLPAFLASAPPSARVELWHACNALDQDEAARYHVTPRLLVAASAYVRAVARDVAPGVLVGQGFATYPVWRRGQDLTPWVCPGLDWYGLDGYQGHDEDRTPASVFGPAIDQARSAGATGPLLITETNSSVDQAAWFDACLYYAAWQGMAGMFGFFGGGANAWQPELSATWQRLQRLAANMTGRS